MSDDEAEEPGQPADEAAPEPQTEIRIHGSAVALGGEAVLFIGSSGSGKSSTALEMIALGARLVSDDQVLLRKSVDGARLVAHPIEGFEGLVEARGIGVIKVKTSDPAPLGLVVDLDQTEIRRMPPDRFMEFLGIGVNLIYGKDNHSLSSVLVAGMSVEI